MWIATIAAGTPHQLIFAGEQPMPMAQAPWGGAGSHPERTFWGEKASTMEYFTSTIQNSNEEVCTLV